MAKNPSIFFVPFLAAFCCLQSSSNAQTAQTSSEVTALLNSYSKPLNLTMGREFLAKVHDSELGLCLNLNETEYKTSTANTSLASLHVRVTNYSSLKNSVLQFPCLHCPNLTSTSPNAKFVLNNETVENMTCLAGSRFADDFQVTQQNPFRLSDVLTLSIIDGDMSFVNFSQGEAVHLQMPLVRLPNTSRPYTLSCVTRSLHTSQWSISSCTTNQTLKQDNQTSFVQCNCSALGYYAVYVHYNDSSDYNGSSPWNWNYGGGNFGGNSGGSAVYPTPYTGSLARLSLSIDADCTILSNATTKADFLNSTRYSIAVALNISVDHIINMVANCGSIVVNFTLLSPDGTNGTLNAELLEFSDLIRTDSFKVPVENSLVYPLTLGISANYNLTIPTSIASLYYIRKTATTPPVTTKEIQSLTIDYTPFMAAVAAILLVVVTCICGTCCAHSWYLRKKKYTQFNSNKVKPKIEEPVVEEEEEEVTPPEFPMTFTERQEVDERKMSKYDWARTSFAQEQNDTSAFLTSAAAVGPRLIMDCDSDDESESPLPPGDVAINMEEISEESESSGEGSGESTSEEEYDDEEYDPRNYECEDSFVESEAQSRASLPSAEDGIRQEGGEHENEESREDEGENKEAEDKQTEGGQTNEDDQDTDDRRNEEENQNPDNDVRQDDDVRGDDVRDGDDTQAGDVTKDDVTQDYNEDNDGIPEDSPPRAPSRDEGASSRVNGVMSRNGGMPEPCM